MKFTATDRFKAIALGSGKYIQCRAYARITSVLNDPLDSGVAWIDVSNYLATEENEPKLPVMSTTVEWKVGKPTFDSIELEGIDIPFWRDQIFGACSNTQLIEFKIELKLGMGENDLCTDVVYGFSGWVDKIPRWREKDGLVYFTVIGYDELGSRISAETITTQIIRQSCGISAKDGLYLKNIPGVYVVDANITSYVLKKGIHVLKWEYNSGTERICLDGGTFVDCPATDDYITLTNDVGDQKVQLFVDVSEQNKSGEGQQDIIVVTAGTTVPKTWYQDFEVWKILKILYSKIEIDTVEFADDEISTYDDRYELSYYGYPSEGLYLGKPQCMVYDSSNNRLWIGMGTHLCYRNISTREYTDLGEVLAGYNIVRLWTEKISSGELWGLVENSIGYYYAFCVTISTGSINNWPVTITQGISVKNFALAKDFSTSGVIFHISNLDGDDIYYFDLSSKTNVLAVSITDLDGYSNSAAWSNGTDYFLQNYGGSTGMVKINRIYKSEGSWYQEVINPATSVCHLNEAAYNENENKSIMSADFLPNIYSLNHADNSITTIKSVRRGYGLTYINNKIYFIDYLRSGSDDTHTPASISSDYEAGYGIAYQYNFSWSQFPTLEFNALGFNPTLNRFYFLEDISQKLVIFGQNVPMSIPKEIDFEGMYVIDAIREIEESFTLIGVVSPNKKVCIYKRFDKNGNSKTSGNAVSITVDETEDIEKEENYIQSCTVFEVSNDEESHNFDGTYFDVGLLGDGRKGEIKGRFIPTNLLKDIAWCAFIFFNKNLSLYTFPLANVSLWQYECFDGLTVTFTSTKIQKTGMGPLYGVGIDPSGSTIFKVLL